MAEGHRRRVGGAATVEIGVTGCRSLRCRLMLGLAGTAVAWERLWPRLWTVAAVIALFVAVALLDVLPALPVWLHVLVLAVFAGALVVTIAGIIVHRSPLRRSAARHRLERDSGLAHRPLAALEDRLAAGDGDAFAETLWRAHRERAAAAARGLIVRLPSPGVPRRDPMAMRWLVVLALIVGVVTGGGDMASRLARAVTPATATRGATVIGIDVWITSPEYTHLAPLYLRWPAAADSDGGIPSAAASRAIPVAAGSAVLVQATGFPEAPDLVLGTTATPLSNLGGGRATGTQTGHSATARIDAADRLSVRLRGRTIADWPLAVIPDQAPRISFAAVPTADGSGYLGARYAAEDDYGVESVTLIVEPPASSEAGLPAMRLSVPLPQLSAKAVTGSSSHDLAAHIWAGEEVAVRLEARDGGGQTGGSAVVAMRLPEREFTHPVAREIIDVRKVMAADTRETRMTAARQLAAIASRPQRFGDDVVVSLALAVAAARLQRDMGGDAVTSVRGMLWESALRLEQGTVPAAERALLDARQRLYDALRAHPDDDVINRLVDELQRALDGYLAAVAAELARKGELDGPQLPTGEVIRGDDLKDLLELARQLARAGARDSARQLLSELQRILDDIRQGLSSSQGVKEIAEAHRLMKTLRELADRQQNLLDRSFDRHQESMKRSERGATRQGIDTAAEATEQEAMRRQLGEVMMQGEALFGGIPPQLGEAERAMREAAQALAGRRPGDAVGPQGRAVEQLRGALEATSAMFARRFGGGGVGEEEGEGASGEGSDPFGRFGSGGRRGWGTDDVAIPEGGQLRHVDEVLRELRRRAGETSRPPLELDYIERLLRRF